MDGSEVILQRVLATSAATVRGRGSTATATLGSVTMLVPVRGVGLATAIPAAKGLDCESSNSAAEGSTPCCPLAAHAGREGRCTAAPRALGERARVS